MDKEIFNGALWVGETEDDYIITWETHIPELPMLDQYRFEYNQWNTPHCTVYGSFGSISDLFNKEFNEHEQKDFVDYCIANWKPANDWWFTRMAVHYVCKRWNEINSHKPVKYERTDIFSDFFIEAFKKWYTIVVTYKGNWEYNRDIYDNWIVDWVSFSPSTYGHCVALCNKDNKITVKDNYKGAKWKWGIDINFYELKDLNKLIKNWVFFLSCYVIMENKVDNTEEIKRLNEMKKNVETNIKNNSSLWEETNDVNFKDWLHQSNETYRKKLEEIELELKKYK